MVLTGGWREEEILITVRATPEPSTKLRETSCVAGVTTSGHPIRLFPIPARDLDEQQRFSKYNVIRARVKKATSDARPESHTVDIASIQVIRTVGTQNDWKERNDLIAPFRIANSVEQLEQMWTDSGGKSSETPSLALIRPKSVDRFLIRSEGRDDWTEAEFQKLNQPGLLDKKRIPLEFVPFRFLYRFHCDHPDCNGHEFQALDWEISESYRRWRPKYGEGAWRNKLNEKYWNELARGRDLQFYLGTISQHPQKWTIIGIYYPPKPSQVLRMESMF